MSATIQSKGVQNREKILHKADELIFKKGYHQMSFGDIAKALGMAKGNFYYYFKSKEDILNGVVNTRVKNIQTMLNGWALELNNPIDRAKRFVDILSFERENIIKFGCPIGSLFVELGKADKALQRNIKILFKVFIDWLDEQFSLLGLANAPILARDLVAKVQGVALLSNVFEDNAFIDHSIIDIHSWIDSLAR